MAIPSSLVDTNILLRMTRRSDPHYPEVESGLAKLARGGTRLYFAHQNIAELWNAMTRPVEHNGLGLTIQEAEHQVRAIEAGMELLPDNDAVYQEWRRLVLQYAIRGVQVHDARIAAVMNVHRVGHILTMNIADFQRFSSITVLHPARI